MKYLLEIAKIVTKRKVKKIEIFDNQVLKQKQSKFNEFYQQLINGNIKTDQEAALLLYDSPSNDDKYRQLKSRFKKRLLNTLFFLDVNQSAVSSYERAAYHCHREWALIKILEANQAPLTVAQLTKQLLQTALKFHFSDLIVATAKLLKQYALKEKDLKAFEQYSSYCKTYQQVQLAESAAEEYHQLLLWGIQKPQQSINAQLEEYCQALNELKIKYPDSPQIFFSAALGQAQYYQYSKQYQQLVDLCEEVEQQSTGPSFYQQAPLQQFAKYHLLACLQLQQYEKGLQLAATYLTHFGKTDAWIDLYEYALLLTLHDKRYNQAHELFDQVYEDKRYKQLNELQTYKWAAFEAYLCFLRLWFNPESAASNKRYKQFRVRRFLEEPIIFPKAYRIFTITMVIGQMLFLLEEGRWGEAFERVERLKGYAARLLKQDVHLRTIQFLRLLQQLAKAHFNYEQIGVHQKYLDRLHAQPFDYHHQLDQLEIIPYEQLWSLLLEICKKRYQE